MEDVRQDVGGKMSQKIIKCNCCNKKYTNSQFNTLKSLGIQEFPSDGHDEILYMEMRNCPCGSTISTLIDVGKDSRKENQNV